MEFILLAWLKMDFWYVDTYKNVNECISKAELLFKKIGQNICVCLKIT